MLDADDIPVDLLYQNLKELEIINKFLGGHTISLKGLKEIVKDRAKKYCIIDIGCGGGDSLKAISKWSSLNGIKIQLTGIDLKQDCIKYAQDNCAGYDEIYLRCDDFRNAFAEHDLINVVHASLFCHHFTEKEIVAFIKLCSINGATFLINDLERTSIAYHSIKLLTKLFSKSSLVKNDAPLSVLRGFKKSEWIIMLKQAGIKKYSVKNCWAFRHLVIAYPNA